MKTIDTKSLLLGVCAACLVFTLTSSRSASADASNGVELLSSPSGVITYNKQSQTFYMYNFTSGRLSVKPDLAYKVSGDGSGLTKMLWPY